MVATPPPARRPALVVTVRLVGHNSDALQTEAFKPLYDLQPLVSGGGQLKIENNGDALAPLCGPGEFKKLRLTGIDAYDPKLLPEIAKLFDELTRECSDATGSLFSILWESQRAAAPSFESANSESRVTSPC